MEQPSGDREEEHCDTEINEIHYESPSLLMIYLTLVISKRCQNRWATRQEKIKTVAERRWEMSETT